MAYSKDSAEAFKGGSGQLAVMSELLQRKCNAAIPLVDIGTDVFAFRDDREEVARIQVKTATGIPYKKESGHFADFRLPIRQLERTDAPALFYALAVRLGDEWGSILVISRANLQELRAAGCGSEVKNTKSKSLDLKLYIQFHHESSSVGSEGNVTAKCGTTDLTKYLNAWDDLPPLRPLVTIDLLQA